MKRLLSKINKTSRLKRNIIAEWQPVDVSSPDLVQTVTDAMAMGTQIQIEYEGSGWRLIQPYGWNTSKDGNILLMCYKDTGEIRSYRLDRVLQVLVDSSQLTNQPVDSSDPTQIYEVSDYKAEPEDFEIPPLPNMDEVLEISEKEQGRELPFDDALQYLTDEKPIEESPSNDEALQPITDEKDEPEESKENDEVVNDNSNVNDSNMNEGLENSNEE